MKWTSILNGLLQQCHTAKQSVLKQACTTDSLQCSTAMPLTSAAVMPASNWQKYVLGFRGSMREFWVFLYKYYLPALWKECALHISVSSYLLSYSFQQLKCKYNLLVERMHVLQVSSQWRMAMKLLLHPCISKQLYTTFLIGHSNHFTYVKHFIENTFLESRLPHTLGIHRISRPSCQQKAAAFIQ